MASKKAVVYALGTLAHAYPAAKITEGTAAVWEDILKDINDESVLLAVKDYISGPSEFCPSVGQIRQLAFDLADGPSLSGAEAWEQVGAWLSGGSSDLFYGLEPEQSYALHAMAGDPWMLRLGIREGREMLGPCRARFIEAYEAARARKRTASRMHPDVKRLVDEARKELVDDTQDA